MISIITPVLNGENFIINNIESIKSLTIPHEHIVVDGGSTDGTLQILSRYTHLKVINQNGKTGMYGAIDQGIRASKSKFLTYINADDEAISEGFLAMYDTINNSNIDMVYSDAIFRYKESSRTTKVKGKVGGKYLLQNGILPFVQPSSIFSRTIYDKIGGLRFDKFRICGDLDLFQRMALLKDSKISYVPVTSSIFFKYNESLGNSNAELYLKEKTYLNVNKGNKKYLRPIVYFFTLLSYVIKK